MNRLDEKLEEIKNFRFSEDEGNNSVLRCMRTTWAPFVGTIASLIPQVFAFRYREK